MEEDRRSCRERTSESRMKAENRESFVELMAKMEGQIPLDEDEREKGRVAQPEDMT